MESTEPFIIGRFKATFQKKHSRWVITSAKGAVGGRKTREKCVEEMDRLCEAEKAAPEGCEAGSEIERRKSSRSSTLASSARPPTKPRAGAYRAGPGRSHTKPSIDPITTAIGTAKTTLLAQKSHTKAEVVSALSQMVEVNTSLKLAQGGAS